MYIVSLKEGFASYFDLNIRLPPVLKTCSTVDPRFSKMKWLNEADKANISQCLINGMVANMASILAAENEAHTDTQAGLLRKPTPVEFSVLACDDSEVDDDNAEQDHYAIVQAERAAFRARKSEPLGSDPLLFWKQHSASYPN